MKRNSKDTKNKHLRKSNRKQINKSTKNNTILKKKRKNKILYNSIGGSMKTCECVDYDIINNQYSLQYNPTAKNCKNQPEEGSKFCSKHKNCPNFMKTIVSGYEHDYDPNKWKHPYIEGSHNCYTYFLNDQIRAVKDRCNELCNKFGYKCPKKIEQCSNLKPQPGHYSNLLNKGNLDMGHNKYNCPLMEGRIMGDNETIKKVGFGEKCPKYHYKGAMVVDPGHTYHFYRQNKDGSWSHKPGTLPVTNKDASDKVIYVPHNADRNYNKNNSNDGIDYVDFCGYYCIPNNKYVNTHSI